MVKFLENQKLLVDIVSTLTLCMLLKRAVKLGMMVCTCNPSIWKAEVGGLP